MSKTSKNRREVLKIFFLVIARFVKQKLIFTFTFRSSNHDDKVFVFLGFPTRSSLYLVKLAKDDKIIQLAKAFFSSMRILIINYGNSKTHFYGNVAWQPRTFLQRKTSTRKSRSINLKMFNEDIGMMSLPPLKSLSTN